MTSCDSLSTATLSFQSFTSTTPFARGESADVYARARKSGVVRRAANFGSTRLARAHDRLGAALGAKDDQQTADHCSLLVVVQLNDVLVRKHL